MTLGSTVVRFDSVTSTNDIARDLAGAGAEEGVAVIAGSQTAGRGSKGRSWSSPPGEGLYLSVILRPRLEPTGSPILTLAAAVAVATTFRTAFGAAADIKWPNDILLGGRKVCGILVESATQGGALSYAVLGIGVNLLQSEFPPEIRDRATSLLIETGLAVTPDEFEPRLFEQLERWYPLAVSSPPEIISRFGEMSSYTHGCRVRIVSGASPGGAAEYQGTTGGLTESGALIVVTDDGKRRVVVSGEIDRLRRASE
jgi:BirA family biotin operon repressor/biotin-[acetyl-CoA-carboxylase] ligase